MALAFRALARLLHCLGLVTAHSDALPPTSTAETAERFAAESPAFAALCAEAAATLRVRAPDIATRWAEQSRTVALRDAGELGPTDEGSPTAALVLALADTLVSEGATSETLVALGLAFGSGAFGRGATLHHTLKGLDLLAAMALYATEAGIGADTTATAADGIRLGRRLQHASSLLTLAATKGYTQAMSDLMRERFRHLRHDLRNPLGTIKSVLAMMDDETMPVEARAHPRFRAMAKRNARSLGDLIADRLSDAEAVMPARVQQSASLRTIACGVRRDLRAKALARGATVSVAGGRARVTLDAAGLELVLHELLLAALSEAVAGDELRVEFGDVRDEHVSVTVTCVPAREPIADADALQRLVGLAARIGGVFQADGAMVAVVVPGRGVDAPTLGSDVGTILPVAAAGDSSPPTGSPPSAARDAGYDIRRAGEREHGQPRPF